MSAVTRQRATQIQAGKKIRSGDVNAELDHLVGGVNDNNSRLTTAEVDIAATEDDVINLERGYEDVIVKGISYTTEDSVGGSILMGGASVVSPLTVTLHDPAALDDGGRRTLVAPAVNPYGAFVSGLGHLDLPVEPSELFISPGGFMEIAVLTVLGVKKWAVVRASGVFSYIIVADAGLTYSIKASPFNQHIYIAMSSYALGSCVIGLPARLSKDFFVSFGGGVASGLGYSINGGVKYVDGTMVGSGTSIPVDGGSNEALHFQPLGAVTTGNTNYWKVTTLNG